MSPGIAGDIPLAVIQKQYHRDMAAKTAQFATEQTGEILSGFSTPNIGTSVYASTHPETTLPVRGPYNLPSAPPSLADSQHPPPSPLNPFVGRLSQSAWSDRSDLIETPLRQTISLDQSSSSSIGVTYLPNFQYSSGTDYSKSPLPVYHSPISSLSNLPWGLPIPIDQQYTLPVDPRVLPNLTQAYDYSLPSWIPGSIPISGYSNTIPLTKPELGSGSGSSISNFPNYQPFPPSYGYSSVPPAYDGFGLGADHGMLSRGNGIGALSSTFNPSTFDQRGEVPEGSSSILSPIPKTGLESYSPLSPFTPDQQSTRTSTSAPTTPQPPPPLFTRRTSSRRHSTIPYQAPKEVIEETEEMAGPVKRGRKRKVEEVVENPSSAWEDIVDKKERRKMQNKIAQRAFRARTRDHPPTASAGRR